MIEYLLLSLCFFKNNYYFFFFILLFCLSCLNVFSWGGLPFFVDSYSYVVLILMSLIILGLILFKEKQRGLLYLSQCLVFISVLYFIPSGLMIFYVLFEISIFPVLFIILGYGYQIEKLNAFYYLLIYASFCSLPFLFIYFSLDFSFILAYFDLVLSWELAFILSLTFIIKFPVFFLHL